MSPTGGAEYGTHFHGAVGIGVLVVPDVIRHFFIDRDPSKYAGTKFGRTRNFLFGEGLATTRSRTLTTGMARAASGPIDRVVGGRGFTMRTSGAGMGPSQPNMTDINKRVHKQMSPWRRQSRVMKGLGWTLLASSLVDIAAELFTPGINKVAQEREEQLFADERSLDSPIAYTQRQRALMAIHDSQMTVRNIIGQEAQFFHR